jgi:geranylgeranyl pyrophosphate synthase
MIPAAQRNKEDFTDWMSPNLRAYYGIKIDYLRKVIDEIIPSQASKDFARAALEGEDHELPLSKLDKAMYQPMREYIKFSGKLFRPLLTCLLLEAYGKDPDQYKPIITISELIHSSSLMLDDIADASLTRRGSTCAHLNYGIPRAANASSAMTFHAFQMIKALLPALKTETKNMLYEMLLWEHFVTNLGSALDLGWSWKKRNQIPEEEFMQHILFRSCSYTYRHAARLGAIVGGADADNLDLIFKYSTLLGQGFQLVDDILNLKPALTSWGKTVGEDITEGKRSLLVLYCLDKASADDRFRLLEILDSHTTKSDDLAEAIKILDQYGSFSYVLNRAREYINEAIEVVDHLDIPEKYKTLLKEFAMYVTDRKV